jgi:DNA replication protein DnaC
MAFSTSLKTETVKDILIRRLGSVDIDVHTPIESSPAPIKLVLDEATKAKHYARAVDRLGIGELYNTAYFGANGEIKTTAQTVAKAWAERIKSGDKSQNFLVLMGTCGVGKTWAGISALLDLAVTFKAVGFENPDWLSHVNGRFFTHFMLAESVLRTDDGGKLRQSMLNTPVLMLDDLRAEGTGRVSDALVAWMDSLIDHRYSHCLPTIITSNTTGDQFKTTYGEKIEDRLRHKGVIKRFSDESLRKVNT